MITFAGSTLVFRLSLEREKTEEWKIFIDDKYTHKIE